MSGHPIRRVVALFASAALLASLAATAAAPVAAADTCQGKPVPAKFQGTPGPDKIIGTPGNDVIHGHAGNDVIMGRGGNDIICGGLGNDKIGGNAGNDQIYSNGGNDRVFGGIGDDMLYAGIGNDVVVGNGGNDTLNGGHGIDLCLQKTGVGTKTKCELPAEVAPKVDPPDPIVLKDVIAIAYTDLNMNHKPDSGVDVMIAMLVDKNGNGSLDNDDQVVMGMYPTKLKPVWPADFEAWSVKSHELADPPTVSQGRIELDIPGDGPDRIWFVEYGYYGNDLWRTDTYRERDDVNPGPDPASRLLDDRGTFDDELRLNKDSLSHPATNIDKQDSGSGDDYFIDVEIYESYLP